mmetsp:Transcript_12484/g.44305  ORF Transcript_12484/g.44305 Transcript_12484/m.44305 type:complete len:329 (-) Transcript_12484:7-993(-)
MGTSSSTRLSSGRSVFTKGSTSLASQTSLHMLSMTTQHLRFVCTSRSRRPRPRTGTMMASVGRSTWETNVVPMRRSRARTFSLGLALALIRMGTMGCTSGLWMTVQHSPSESLAAFFTSGLVSHMLSVTLGTISGSSWPTCVGAVCASTPSSLRHPTLIFHCDVAMPAKTYGSSVPAAYALTDWKKAVRQASAEAVTTLTLSSYVSMRPGSILRTYGSACRPSAVMSAWTTAIAPSRAGTDLRSASDAATRPMRFISTTDATPASLIAAPSSAAAATRASGVSSVVALTYNAVSPANADMLPELPDARRRTSSLEIQRPISIARRHAA